MRKLTLLLFPAIIFAFRTRLLEGTCPPMNNSYAIYLIDAKINSEPSCNYTLIFVTGDCSYASSAIKGNGSDAFCLNDSSLVCDGIDTNVLGGFLTKHCGDDMTVELFEPVLRYSTMKEFTIKSPNAQANVFIGSTCNQDINSDPLHWPIPELRSCQSPIEAEALEMESWSLGCGGYGGGCHSWGCGRRFYGRRYGSRCGRRNWRNCWHW